MKGPAIVAITPTGGAIARRLAGVLKGAEVHTLSGRVDDGDVVFGHTIGHLASLFKDGRAIVGVCAAGILVRAVAPLLSDKMNEPPVVAIDEAGESVVPILGGHRGANQLARSIAAETGAYAALTTASDVALGLSLDDLPSGYELANPEHLKGFTGRLLAGEALRISGDPSFLDTSGLNVRESALLDLTISEYSIAGGPDRLVVHPKNLVIGIGAERGADPSDALELVRELLDETGLAHQSVALLASLDLKEDEPAVHFVSETYLWPARYFDAECLEAETPRLTSPSDTVYKAVGCHGVAEAAALAATGPEGELIVAKRIGRRVTCALARASRPLDVMQVGRARASLAIVGLGPGGRQWRSQEADQLICQATDIVGYNLYLDLAGPLSGDQTTHAFALGEETARVTRALELACEGRRVALVSSGDAGIYGMAALAYEMIASGPDAWRRIAVTVSPGISALQAAAARAGAPLGHDFCAISLSDLMTPALVIEQRIRAAAQGDFVIAFYNPASRRRRKMLSRAIEIVSQFRAGTTPLVVARELGRHNESVEVVQLNEFDADAVDMLSLVLVGSSTTQCLERTNGVSSIYTPRGYSVDHNRPKLPRAAR